MSKKDRSKFKKKLLQQLREDVYCKMAASDIHGVGVFAIRVIPKGAYPFKGRKPYKEVRVSRKELQSVPYAVRRLIDTFCLTENGTILIPELGLNAMDMPFYINHSKRPNLCIEENGSIKTKRSVLAGEELTMDYDATFGGEHLFRSTRG